ncbi:hypothetical protein LZ198_02910 [Myxococcus sp. K15C18031901]|uniref:hypothetical protein n=1 Tax=Myxococcus dinghuensis TaxID=2906761 RepID=UPI0020A8313D|nr:hypothetical protein [Myxococcus dinghuensis]MCP3097820.1 hypothetical protein [Myxococcus dinghuensis]
MKKLPGLQHLVLDHTRLGDEILPDLSRLELSYVSLPGTQVTQEGVARLRHRCPTLKLQSAFKQYTAPQPEKTRRGGLGRFVRALLKRG